MKTLIVALALGFLALPAQARQEYLGGGRLSRSGGAITFATQTCRQGERMDALRIVVRNQPALIDMLGVQYRNGRVERIRVQTQFPANSQTRWINLRGNGCARAIQITGRSLNLLQKATVEIYGHIRQNHGWPGGNNGGWPGENDGYNDGYGDDDGNWPHGN